MCGIAGIVGRPDRNAIQRMIDAMTRREPDDSGIYADPLVALGHRRLSILDLSPAAHQPMSRAGGRLWIVYNGEVYNFAALRKELEATGHQFVSRSDTAGILASGLVNRDIDRVALVQYLMHGHVVQPRTMQNVAMLPAAHFLTYWPGHEPLIQPYWGLESDRCAALSRGLGFDEQAARLRTLLEEAARAQMVSDVPLGAFLSGGGDSSTLVALMTRVSGRPVHTFSVGFADAGADLDESEDVQRSARHLGAIHSAVRVDGGQVADALPRIAPALGQPTIDGVNMYFVSEAARSGVTVALSGLGGDEMFAGHATFPILSERDAIAPRLRRALGKLRRSPSRWVTGEEELERAWKTTRARHGFAMDYMSFHMVRSPQDAWALAGRPVVAQDAVFAYLDADDPTIEDPLSRITRFEISLYMNSQLLRDADAASMEHSLEVRVPLLDVEVAEFAFGLPAASKLGPVEPGGATVGKRVFLRAVSDFIPDWTWRKPKRGFTLPFGEWLRGPIRPLAEDALGDSAFAGLGWVDAAAVDLESPHFLHDRSAHWSVVWTTLMLALWAREAFLPGRHSVLSASVQGVH